MRFLLDMGVSVRVADWLRQQGHDAVHLRDEGLQQLSDRDILAKATAENRVTLTFDLDFAEIVALSPHVFTSVIIFRLRHPKSPTVIRRLNATLPAIETALINGAIVVIEDAHFRVRPYPFGPNYPTP
jgi:predicted nuclease of predicted toxin-antitoxin system